MPKKGGKKQQQQAAQSRPPAEADLEEIDDDDHTTQQEQQEEEEAPKHDKSKQDLARVNAGDDQDMGSESASQAAATQLKRNKQRAEEAARRQKELASVKVKEEDIDLIAEQMETTKKQAEQVLRENKGSLKDALKALLVR
ncbi:hypothetical protein PTSG_03566 [Salpingoeca rosetta]|uniref:Nascent polypeptide-associated complex subunit alpha-like UBA domain-containing protein n=1 Tax=Salpingoeca rosetta (strain ATCC 50818 / BSB-021) TaxID=946362 RepID=F2U5Z2_SALR5|nr:uncharacterized protein PTSG_03566 [Salpingoeca rosetta]EGD82933.1 hypothetical protein PTSG_03566 [Salpingoeca rosetta]|eukprot:XP_004995297.1 hypothetical protein PTSG_03566 [Salpingoeca rosetta]